MDPHSSAFRTRIKPVEPVFFSIPSSPANQRLKVQNQGQKGSEFGFQVLSLGLRYRMQSYGSGLGFRV